MNKKYRYLSKNIFLFTISGFVPKILSFILVPIYTSYLTTSEYGIVDLISTTVLLLLPIFTLDVQDAVLRFALDKNVDKKEVFSISIKIILVGNTIIFLATFIISFFGFININKVYLLYFCMLYFVTSFYNTISLFCRSIDKINVITIASILNSTITLILNILLLVVFKFGLVGYLAANIIGSVVSLVYCFVCADLYKYIKLKTSIILQKEMITYSLPLIFSVIAWWINNASDRYILTMMSGVAISGIYSVSYKIPNLLSVFQNIFTQAWSISAIKEFDREDDDGFIGNMYTMMNFSMVTICSVIMMMNYVLANLLYKEDFFVAWKYVPPLLISVVFNAMALFIGSIFTAVKDTKTLSISTIIGAMVNIILNFILIYWIGAYGAAIATLIGYAVTFLMRHIILKKHITMKINLFRDVLVYILLIIQMIISLSATVIYIAHVSIIILIILFYKNELMSVMMLLKRRLNNSKYND